MNREGHNGVSAFIGVEIERSPAFGMVTLFLVGMHAPSWIIKTAAKNNCKHVYFGANQSFDPANYDDWRAWEQMIGQVLDESTLLATLDFDVKHAEDFLESGLPENHRMIPMISVKLPYINQLGYNAVVKIDDKDFNATNPGVWCHRLHDLQDPAKITRWHEYTQDCPIDPETRDGI